MRLHHKFLLLDKVAFMRAEYLYLSIILFAFIALILVVSMLLIILHIKARLKIRSWISGQLEPWIMDIILESNADEGHVFEVPATLKNLLQGDAARRILSRELVNIKKSLSGLSGRNLEKVYSQLNLQQISLKRIANKHWHIKVKGIQDLAIMAQQGNSNMLFELTNDKDPMVRMEAQTAMVRLQGYKGLQFFDNLIFPLSEWHQLNLLYLLGSQPITAENGIFNWLHADNPTVVQFSLKLIAEQHAIEFHEDVVKCLNHESDVVRKAAVICLGQMPSNEAATEMHKLYAREKDKNVKLCIIKELMRTGSDQDFPFLQILQHDGDVDIKLAANKTVLYLKKIL